MNTKKLSCWVVTLLLGLLPISSVYAQTAQVKPLSFEHPVSLRTISDNGLWLPASGVNSDNATLNDYPYLINMTTKEIKYLLTKEETDKGNIAAVFDVTDDGKTTVGCYNEYPAIYKDGKWSMLPVPVKDMGGQANAITPDGRFIVGTSNATAIGKEDWAESPLLWIDGVYTVCEGLPTLDIAGNVAKMNRFIGISPDGNNILGCLSYSYPGQGCCVYVYNRISKTHEIIGQKEMSEYSHIGDAFISPNGKWVGGTMHYVDVTTNPIIEADVPFKYNIETKELTTYTDKDSWDTGGFTMCNDGTIIGCNPYTNPVRTLKYRVGKFWYNLDVVLKEKYGIDFTTSTGFDFTGLPMSVSGDGKILAAVAIAHTQNYVVTLPETFAEAAKSVNLLANYSISPVAGSTFNKASTFTISFDREAIVLDGAKEKIHLYEGKKLIAEALSVKQSSQSEKSFIIGFRPQTLVEGKRYTLKIPAGCFGIEDTDMKNKEIEVSYIGRDNRPVTPEQYSMPDGSSQSELSYSQNLTIRFDIPIMVAENKVGYLYQDGNEDPLCELQLATSVNFLAVYPLLQQHLYLGSNYTVVIPEGAVTDNQGDCGNEEIVLHYEGIYKKEAPTPGSVLFDVDFSNPNNSYNYFLMYEGDKLTPTQAMQKLGFDNSNTPWHFVIRESEATTNYCAGSTSMYSPAGESNDWMATVQLEIPSDKYVLSWKSQSYKKNKQDVLRVYIWECDDELNNLSEAIIQRIEAEGEKVYEKTESPGEEEENLEGEWAENKIHLDKYKGKKIYIAFLNRNNNQSMIFVDDIKVEYEGKYSMGVTTPNTVKMQDEVEISGFVEITSKEEGAVYKSVKASFQDATGKTIDEKTMDGLHLVKGDRHEFKFDKKLSVELGKITSYTLTVELDGDLNKIKASVKNLSFVPTKRIVLEEGTGSWCANCPLGILAIEYLQKSFPNSFIPIAIHSASGGSDAYDYSEYCSALGFTAFPSGRINRIDTIYSPMAKIDKDYSYVSTAGNETFTDIFLRELQKDTELEVNLTDATYDQGLNKIAISANVRSAVDIENANYRVAYIILENGLSGIQANNLYNTESLLLGDWGKNGKYATPYAAITYNHVARAYIGKIDGTSGMIPTNMTASTPYNIDIADNIPASVSDMKNASVVCLVLNANTNQIVNAAEINFSNNPLGIEETTNENQTNAVTSINGKQVSVRFNQAADAVVTLYGMNGLVIDQVAAKVDAGDSLTASAKGYSGVVAVRIMSNGAIEVQKVYVR